jgi:formate C-acetyltransferase
LKKERLNNGLLDVDNETISTINSHKPGYIEKDLEEIV